MPEVSIIILNWNQPELTVNCVKSVLKQDYRDFEILLVDNGSEDNSLEIFRKEFKENKKIRILETGKNLGYAGGNNFGVKNSKGKYVVILNNDTIVEKNWLRELVNGIKNEKEIGAVSSLEIRENQEERDWSKNPLTLSLVGYPVEFKYKDLEKENLLPIFVIVGCSFIYKKNLISKPFDPEYFIYNEEIYLAWLLNLKGYKNKIATNSKVHHLLSMTRKSNKRIDRYFIFLGERNRIMNLLIFYELSTLIRIFPLIFVNIVLLNLTEPRKIIPRFRAYLWLLSHPRKIMKKRNYIQKQRKIPDREIVKILSCKLRDETVFKNKLMRDSLKIINSLFCIYCRALGLRTIEFEN